MKPNFALRIVYHFFKGIANIGLWIYFGKNIIVNRKGLDFDGAAIVVSNHPHAFFDPVVPASKSPRYFYFLANYGLFKNPFMNWFLNTFFCIPIKRRKDNWGGNLKNEDSFDRAENHLANDGVLYIAVEGTTFIKRRIREVKTGFARIALAAESENDWKLDLKIVPVGNNFAAPTRFRGKVFVEVGDPIRVSDFREDFEKDKEAAYDKLVALLGQKLSELTIDIPTVEEERMIRYLEEIYKTETQTPNPPLTRTSSAVEKHKDEDLRSRASRLHSKYALGEIPNDSESYFERKALSHFILNLKKESPESFKTLKSKTLAYGNQLRAWRISDEILTDPKNSFSKIIGMILSLPIFLWGAINNLLPYFILKYFSNNPKLFIGYRSTARVLLGLFIVVPIFYTLQTWLIYRFSGNGYFTVAYFLLLIPTGMFAWYWKEELKTIKRKMRFFKIKKANPKKVEKLNNLRSEIIKSNFQ